MTTIPCVNKTRLVALLQDPATTTHAWADRAACTGTPAAGDPYFPDDDQEPSADALAACAACPVAHQCLATALVHEAIDGYRFGWWGGFGPAEREALWDALDLATPQPVKVDLRNPAAIAQHLRSQRRTVPVIAAALGCSERTVYRYLAANAA